MWLLTRHKKFQHCWLWRWRKKTMRQECGRPGKAGKDKDKNPPLWLPERNAALSAPWFEPSDAYVELSDLHKHKIIHFCFKPSLWQIISAANRKHIHGSRWYNVPLYKWGLVKGRRRRKYIVLLFCFV